MLQFTQLHDEKNRFTTEDNTRCFGMTVSRQAKRQAKRDLLGVKIQNHCFAYVNSLIFSGSEYVYYMMLSQL